MAMTDHEMVRNRDQALHLGRMYEFVSTRPQPTLNILATIVLSWMGTKANEDLIAWYTTHRATFAWLSTVAKIIALIAWYAPWRDVAIIPVLVCCMPKLVCTLLLLSVPILQILLRQYEFWFATTLNVIATVLFSHQLGFNMSLGYACLSCLSIQVTILSDADVYTLSETARAGILSSVYAVALGVFALYQSAEVSSRQPAARTIWLQAELNLLANVAATLAIFLINKTLKRRGVFRRRALPFIPLAVCRAHLALRRKNPRSPLPVASARVEELSEFKPSTSATSADPPIRRSSSVLSSARFAFRVRPQPVQSFDSRDTLFPRLCVGQRLPRERFLVLTSCGVLGLCLAGITLFLIVILDFREQSVLYPCAVLSLILTATYCLAHAVHYQREIFKLLVHNFDFWFLSMQFISATVCLADLLQWDYRCLCIVSWSLWFHWVLLVDAMLTTHARKLHFRKRHATPVLLAVLFGILVLTYSLAIDKRDILHDRAMNLGSLGKQFTLSISTGTFMAYRLATIWLWTVRLVSRLAKYPEEKLIFLRGAVEYRNPFFVGIVGAPSIQSTINS